MILLFSIITVMLFIFYFVGKNKKNISFDIKKDKIYIIKNYEIIGEITDNKHELYNNDISDDDLKVIFNFIKNK